ncbi:50S ribosomal protein L1 [candidate division TA06 bacterium]|uniref:Large ribosomal subunit protein uL1 n=1 Tax=candidate division TA06 bacterium TaxID=2250710 RepID=A0A523USB6_UNCT6|nr:MAG: 50S ribosomal protein L1 [candidate division TA06 bacterium]
MKPSKRYKELAGKVDSSRFYALRDAVALVKETSKAKFDETIEMNVQLGVDPKRSDQMVRGTVELPHGRGKKVRILVLTKGEKEKEAQEAGADYVGSDEYMEKIKSGWFDFDAVVATPDIMSSVAKLGKILGPRGLMPNPKVGSVTFEVGKAVRAIQKGKVEFRLDKSANLHVPIGKASFDAEKLYENGLEFLKEAIRLRPATAKGTYIRSISICSTMGPGIHVDLKDVQLAASR